MTNSMDKLSEMSGISKDTLDEIWKEVKANNETLNKCEGPHTFKSHKVVKFKWVCSKCGGHTSATQKVWYEKGLEHGRNKK